MTIYGNANPTELPSESPTIFIIVKYINYLFIYIYFTIFSYKIRYYSSTI
jgi:hypothetical protein